jgi:hypothetical protein
MLDNENFILILNLALEKLQELELMGLSQDNKNLQLRESALERIFQIEKLAGCSIRRLCDAVKDLIKDVSGCCDNEWITFRIMVRSRHRFEFKND